MSRQKQLEHKCSHEQVEDDLHVLIFCRGHSQLAPLWVREGMRSDVHYIVPGILILTAFYCILLNVHVCQCSSTLLIFPHSCLCRHNVANIIWGELEIPFYPTLCWALWDGWWLFLQFLSRGGFQVSQQAKTEVAIAMSFETLIVAPLRR